MRVVRFNGSARKGGDLCCSGTCSPSWRTRGSKPSSWNCPVIGEMVIPGSCYWNIGVGREIGDVEKDEGGVATMRTLGRNMAWLMKRLGGEG